MKDIKRGKGYGFETGNGHIFLIKCFECGKENYTPTVSSGICAWCGYNANGKPEDKCDKGVGHCGECQTTTCSWRQNGK